MTNTTVLPTAPAGYHTGFDLYAFDGRDKHRAISKKTQISWNDYGRMHQKRAKGTFRRSDPQAWAMSDALLQETIVTFLERRAYCYQNASSLSIADRLQRAQEYERRLTKCAEHLLDARLSRRASPLEIQNVDTQIVIGRRGMASIVAAACYLRFRCNWTSTEIANEIGIKPPHCRQIFYRLNKIYNGLKEGKPYRARRRSQMSEAEVSSLLELRMIFGLSWRACGETLGFNPMTCRTRFLKALRENPVALPAI